MGRIISDIRICDNCGNTQDVGETDCIPHNWCEVKMETTNGLLIFSKALLCNGCWQYRVQEGNQKTLLSVFKKFFRSLGEK